MRAVVDRRTKRLEFQKALIDRKIDIEDQVATLNAHADRERRIQYARKHYAACRIQGLVRGFLDRILFRETKERLLAAITIQRLMRGKLGRMRWWKFFYLRTAVVKSDTALEAILERSSVLREANSTKKKGYMWREMFDPLTESIWYYNKRNGRNTWECPFVFQRDLICTWNGFENFGGLPSEGPCRQVFGTVLEYQNHIKTEHRWYCSACEHCNSCANFPKCTVCSNTLDENGKDGEKALDQAFHSVHFRLNMFLRKDGAERKPDSYVMKSRMSELAIANRDAKQREAEAQAVALAEAQALYQKQMEEIARSKATKTVSAIEDGSTLPAILPVAPTAESVAKLALLAKTKPAAPPGAPGVPAAAAPPGAPVAPSASGAGGKKPASKAAAEREKNRKKAMLLGKAPPPLLEPVFPGVEPILGDANFAYSSIASVTAARDRAAAIGLDGEEAMYADPLAKGIIPPDIFNEITLGSTQNTRANAAMQFDDGEDDDDESVGTDANEGAAAFENIMNTGVTGQSIFGAGSTGANLSPDKLLVCQAYLKGECTKTICPWAHPGVRDNATKYYTRLIGKTRKVPYVKICPDYNGVNSECADGQTCKRYHIYIRPSTRDIILRIYPIESGKKTKLFKSRARYDGHVKRDKFNGYGVMSYFCGDCYMGDWLDNERHGFGIYRCADGSEYMGQWRANKRHGFGVAITATGEEYVGEWANGNMEGVGLRRSPTGDVYEGAFVKGKYHGIGRFTKKNGDVYLGYTVEGYACGLGVLALWTGEKYKGQFDRNFRHGKGICSYPNGSKYAGSWYRGSHEGFGVYVSPIRERYAGEWAGGKKHGRGRYYFSNGDFYDGEFAKNKAQGKGAYYHANGNIYSGEWKNDKRNGRGTYVFANGSRYTGQWLDNDIHGKGKFDYATGAFYRGQYEHNIKWGKGIFTWPNGNEYRGDFKNGYMCGTGEMKYGEGHRYVGTWDSNKKNGYGVFTYFKGHVYAGDWIDDVKHGKGKMTFHPRSDLEESYEGDWYHDEKHGVGTYIYPREVGSKYEGEWVHGVRNGKGKITFKDGSYYRGDMRGEQMWGRGIHVGADGSQYDGEWRANMRQGTGTLLGADGSIYHGEFWANMKHGEGRLQRPDGSIYTGTWEGNVIRGSGKVSIQVGRGPYGGPSQVRQRLASDADKIVTVKTLGF